MTVTSIGELIGQRVRAAFQTRQIAAIARVNDLVLVTAKTRDFRRFEGLSIEDRSR